MPKTTKLGKRRGPTNAGRRPPPSGIIIDVAASGRHHAPPPRESHDVIHGCVPPAPISLFACVACSMNFLQEMPKC